MGKDDSVILSMRGVSKRFGAIKALDRVNLTVRAGEVHALIGENGAGKSTLMKILSGAYTPDAGEILFRGRSYSGRDPAAARQSGIAMIYQELNLAPHLTVLENICLGMEEHVFGVIRPQRRAAAAALARLGHPDLDLQTAAGRLSIAEQQVVEIARALLSEAKLIIMDEPTSSLSTADTRVLFRVIRRLRDDGVSVIYISHFLEEVKEVADRFTVLRDGRHVAAGDLADTGIDTLIRHMVGRELDEMFPRAAHEPGDVVLRVKALRNDKLRNVALELREGEILGLAGLVGSGRTELLRAIFGLDKAEGQIWLAPDWRPARVLSPRRAMNAGVDLLSENRKDEGLAIQRPVRDNLTLSMLGRLSRGGIIRGRVEDRIVRRQIEELGIKVADPVGAVATLSGGNQQKVAIGRLLANGARIFLFDEPTRGVDVGSKVEIYRLIGALAQAGRSIVLASSYLPELFGVCDSLAVMHRGGISPKRPIGDWTHEDVMAWATSGRMEVLGNG